jgi:Na+/H+ antiporter
METFELILMLASAVLLSSVLEQVIPRVSLPLIQIALGVVIALFAVAPINITFNPDFFLIVFIAPLLFRDAKEADKLGLWRNRHLILSLAIGLVLGITLVIGFAVNAFIPSIPLAAAFALGAALGPTDAVAVSSLSSAVKLDRKESALLSGESLLNDASGVVAFQFAVAAAVTGSFSLVNASVSFAISFFGGIVLGLVLGWAAHFIRSKVSELGLDSNTFHVLFDVTLPFIIYLSSELLGVSGILAVVAAGLLLSSYTDRMIGPAASRLSIVSNNVWSVLAFTLNGIVFVLLGAQLPRAMQSTWDSVVIDNFVLVGYVLGLSAILVGVRFLWMLIAYYISKDPDTGCRRCESKRHFRSALITTVGGPKGAVTLSVIFSTPLLLSTGEAFPQRNLMIFLASGVILCTLLLANFLLPILAPKPREEDIDREVIGRAKVDIMRAVIDRLAASRSKTNGRAVGAVIKSYNDRIERIQSLADIESESTTKLRIAVIRHQQDYLLELMEKDDIDEVEGYKYLKRLAQAQNYLTHKSDNRWLVFSALRHSSTSMRVIRRSFRRARERLSGGKGDASAAFNVQFMAEREAVDYLHTFMEAGNDAYPSEVVAEVLLSYQAALRSLQSTRPEITMYARTTDGMEEIERFAYNVELDEIRYSLGRGDISRATAKEMRDNVYLMLVDLDAHL